MGSLEVAVDDVAAGGDGIAHAPDGRVMLVHGAVPGDRVAAEITEERPRLLRARVERVLEPSADRVEAPCPHVAAGCGGCGWQHVEADAQRRLKVRIVEESLRRIGHLEAPVHLGSPLRVAGFRTSVRLLVGDGRPAFRAQHSHDPVPVTSCVVAHPALDELIADARFGSAREVTLRVSDATSERVAVFDPAVPDDHALPPDVQVVGRDQLRAGRRVWITEVVGDRRFRVSADSFFQTRTDGAAALVDAVARAGDARWGRGRLVDQYGGVGLFAACLGAGMATTLVEGSRSAVADARHNLADRDARVLRLDVGRWRPSPADLGVADPPRAGLGATVVRRIEATGAGRLVLVSCDAAAFGRDAGLLRDAGYGLVDATLIDLFPHTPHVELVSRFDRERQ